MQPQLFYPSAWNAFRVLFCFGNWKPLKPSFLDCLKRIGATNGKIQVLCFSFFEGSNKGYITFPNLHHQNKPWQVWMVGKTSGPPCPSYPGKARDMGGQGWVVFSDNKMKTRCWQLKDFLCSPWKLGKMNPFWLIFFRWVGSTTN